MQYHLETIPVWEAMEWGSECPLCALRRKTEEEAVERCLGAGVMEPAVRLRFNKDGVCAAHSRMLFEKPNRLGHALLMDSHSKERLDALVALEKGVSAQKKHPNGLLEKLFGNKKNLTPLISALEALNAHCVLCDAIDAPMERYLHTFLHLWKTDERFRTAWENSKGVCLPHVTALLTRAQKSFLGTDRITLAAALMAKLTASLSEDEKDVEWFTLKFDYRNQEAPWGNSRTGLERVINRLRGWCVGETPQPPKKDT